MLGIERDGFAVLLGRLSLLRTGANRVVRSGARKWQRVVEPAMASAAIVASGSRVVSGHQIQPGGLGGSFGSTMKRTAADGTINAKTGLGVGKARVPLESQVTKGGKRSVRYGHWIVVGTDDRWTGARTRKLKDGRVRIRKTGNAEYFRGRVLPHPFIANAAAQVETAANEAMLNEIERGIARQWNGEAE